MSLVVDLVNSAHEGHDHLSTVQDLVGFLKEHQVSGVSGASRSDLEQIQDIRGQLRRVFETADRTEATRIINDLLASSKAQPILTDHDGEPWHLHYTPVGGPPSTRIAAESAMALAVIIAEDGFDRIRTCGSETCDDAFIDGSRNRSRRYCSASICGNRASVRAHRERQRAATEGS